MTTNAGLLFVCCLDTLLTASNLGMALALAMAPSNMPGLYCLAMSISFNSMNLWSLVSGSMQILLILILRENGIEFKHSLGWQLEVNKYWFLSVGFQYKSVTIFPFFIWQEVFRYEIDCNLGQPHEVGSDSVCCVVCVIVNLILG